MGLALLLAVAGGCQGDQTEDAALDARPGDLLIDQRGDGRRDAGLTDQAAADATTDLAADLRREADSDALAPDAQLPAASVLYTTATNPDAFGLRTVQTQDRQPAIVAGFNGGLDIERLLLAGQHETLDLTQGRPQLTPVPERFSGVVLPGGGGTLYSFHRLLLGTSGILLVRADGRIEPLFEVPGIYSNTISDRIGLAADGALGAVVRDGQTVVLFRSDGLPLGSGQVFVELAGSVAGVETIAPQSLTLADGWLYAVGQAADTSQRLLRAPLDGSGPLTEVSLPAGEGGELPRSVALQLATDAARERLVVAAGAGPQLRDLYLVEAASGLAFNLTREPGAIAEQGNLGQQSGKLAVSPDASRVAFVRTFGGVEELYVADGDGGGPRHLSGDSFFEPGVATFMNLVFADDDNLFFWAGMTTFEADLYHWSPGTGISTLSGAGGLQPPFHGLGYFLPQGTWTSPDNRWRYWVLFQPSNQEANIIGVEQGAHRATPISRQIQVQVTPGSLVACPQDGLLYFAARPQPAISRLEIYAFDQNKGLPATQLTALAPAATNNWNARSLRLTRDCSALIWSAGPGMSYHDLWALPLAPAGPPRKLVNLVGYFADSLAFTADDQAVVYGSGLSDSQATLKAVPLAGGNPTVLDPAAGYINIFAVY